MPTLDYLNQMERQCQIARRLSGYASIAAILAWTAMLFCAGAELVELLPHKLLLGKLPILIILITAMIVGAIAFVLGMASVHRCAGISQEGCREAERTKSFAIGATALAVLATVSAMVWVISTLLGG
jgi:hypothetical protein